MWCSPTTSADGLGYPRGLRGEEIPIGGRIISIVDVYDALTSKRPYRRAMSAEEAVQTLRDGAGGQFDPHLVELFIQILPDARCRIEQQARSAEKNRPQLLPAPEGPSALTRIGQAAAEMAAVCDVAHALASGEQDLDQIAGLVVSRALNLLPADTAVLYLKSGTEPELAAIAADGKYHEKLTGMRVRLGEGMAGWVAEKTQPLVNASASLDVARRFSPEESIELNAGTAVPLVHGPEVLGVLAVYTMGYDVIAEHHLNVLNILAEHTAAALQQRRRYQRNRHLALTDPLTGSPNSRALLRRLERLLYAAEGRPGEPEPFSLVMLDLDGFKKVNDTLGHMQGDDLLRKVAEALNGVARANDLVCRYAGDEFLLLLPEADLQQAEEVAARARAAIRSLQTAAGEPFVTASAGVASFPVDAREGRALIHIADQRMYEDKFRRRGGDDVATGAEKAWEPLKLAS